MRRLRLPRILDRIVLALLAASPPFAASAKDHALQLDVAINGRRAGLIGSFVMGPDGRLAASRAELRELGIETGDGDPRGTIRLDDLPGLRYAYDERGQTIALEASDEQRIPKLYGAIPLAETAARPRSDWGGVLNYGLFATSTKDVGGRRLDITGGSATLEARAFSPYGVLSHAGIIRTTPSADAVGLRLDTTFTYSDTERLITYAAGDMVSGGFGWTRPIRIGGVGVSRNFGLRPDLVTAPITSIAGSAAVPSTVDVFVNNVRTFSQPVEAGPYRFNLPAVSGGGEARLVLRDAAGREVQTSLPFFASSALLAPGLIDFSFQAGFPRVGYATETDAYVPKPVAIASLRGGVTDWLTLLGHAETAERLQNGSVGAAVRTGAFGALTAAVSGSLHEGRLGGQVFAAYDMTVLGATVHVSTQRTIGDYADAATVADGWALRKAVPTRSLLGLLSFPFGAVSPGLPKAGFGDARPARAVDRAVLGLPMPDWKAGASLSLINIEQGDERKSRIVSASLSKNFAYDIAANVVAYKDLRGSRSAGILFGLSMPLGDRIYASTGATATRSGITPTAEINRTLERDPGSVGWRVQMARGARPEESGALAYRSQVGTAEVSARRTASGLNATAQFDGAVAMLGSGVVFGDRIDNAFAVVETGMPNVEVRHQNQSVGRTDAFGRRLVPYLNPHGANKIEIDARNLPVDAELDATQEVVAPLDRSGVRVRFGVRTDSTSAVVILTDAKGQHLPAGRPGQVEGGAAFFVGYDGRAFMRGLGARTVAVVELPEGSCRVAFDYAARPGEQVVIGPVACR